MDDDKKDKPLKLVRPSGAPPAEGAPSPSPLPGDPEAPLPDFLMEGPTEDVDLLDDAEQCVPPVRLRLRLSIQVLIRNEVQQEFEPTFHFLQEFLDQHGVGCMHLREADELREKAADLETLSEAMRKAYDDGHRFPEDLMDMLERVEAGNRPCGR